ncbi:MAG: ABC transporter substrate-binding protein [Burkholderiales bacterium]|nr:ABC transporter substrate-binding protein [Burkholderiales bacterium]
MVPLARSIAALLLAVLLPIAAQARITLHDDRGATLVLAAPPQRIVSLLPSFTESVCALGGCAWLVGTDRYSNWPASVRALPKLGGVDDAQIERIVALHPAVVLAAPSARGVDRLEALGVKVLVLESRDLADVKRTLSVLAQMLGTPAQAARVWSGIERDVRAAVARVPAALRGRRVYFEVDATPYAAGAGSFIGELLARMGLANAVPAALGPFPKLNPEYVVHLQPDVVMASAQDLATMPGRPGWGALNALRDGRTCGYTSAQFELLTRSGPRLGEAASMLADCLVSIGAKPAGSSIAAYPAASKGR